MAIQCKKKDMEHKFGTVFAIEKNNSENKNIH